MADLTSGVKMDVEENSGPEIRTDRKQSTGQIQRNAVQIYPRQLMETLVGSARQRERREKVLAELPVAGPGLAFPVPFERERVDMDRPAVMKLYIVGAVVLE